MSLTFVVQRSSGEDASNPVTPDVDFFALRLHHADFPMLAGLHPFGKTIFNRQQAPHVQNELVRLTGEVDAAAVTGIEAIAALAEQVRSAWHLYLVALGD